MGRLWLRWSLRDLRERWLLVVTLALVVAMATGVAAGLGSMESWRLRSNDASFALLHMHDLRVSLTAAGSVPAGTLDAAAAAIPHSAHIAATQERLISPTQVDVSKPGGSVLVPGKLVGVPLAGAGGRIDTRFTQKGRDLRPSDAGKAVAVVEGNFGEYHGVPIPTEARIAGGRHLRLVGQVLQPEQFLVTRPGADFGAEAGYAVLYSSLATVQSLSGRGRQVNELVLRLAPGTDPAVVEAELRRVFATRSPSGRGLRGGPVVHRHAEGHGADLETGDVGRWRGLGTVRPRRRRGRRGPSAMTPILSALVLTNLLYVVGAVVVASLVSGLYVLRHRKPKSLESGIESFSRELRALAPERRGGVLRGERVPPERRRPDIGDARRGDEATDAAAAAQRSEDPGWPQPPSGPGAEGVPGGRWPTGVRGGPWPTPRPGCRRRTGGRRIGRRMGVRGGPWPTPRPGCRRRTGGRRMGCRRRRRGTRPQPGRLGDRRRPDR